MMPELVLMLENASRAHEGLAAIGNFAPALLIVSLSLAAIAMLRPILAGSNTAVFASKATCLALLAFLVYAVVQCRLPESVFWPPSHNGDDVLGRIEAGIIGKVADIVESETVYIGMESVLSRRGNERMAELSELLGAAIVSFRRARIAVALMLVSLLALGLCIASMQKNAGGKLIPAAACLVGIELFVFPISLDASGIRCNIFGLFIFSAAFACFCRVAFKRPLAGMR